MPELPEVETIAKGLRQGRDGAPPLPGRRIVGVTVHWPRHIATPGAAAFRRRIRDRTIQDVDRRGKYLLFPLDIDMLLIHLRMSGDLSVASADTPGGAHDHTIFHLEDGWEMRFNDTRKFGRVYLTDDPETILGKLGPEPLSADFSADLLEAMLSGRRRMLKPLLLDQAFIAGLGNIYVDEALHRAHLHPLRRSDTISTSEAHALWQAIRETLQSGIRNSGASIDWVYRGGDFQNHLRVYQREHEACIACGQPILRIQVAQRGTYYCPHCQPEAVP
jgi:formamidopyrimidine-DNA glycosylase